MEYTKRCPNDSTTRGEGVIIITSTSHYGSINMSGTGYNDNMVLCEGACFPIFYEMGVELAFPIAEGLS